MASLCRQFGISRVTGYKLFNRYKESGLAALQDRSRRPYRHANKLPFQVERTILTIKREHSSWGAPKIRDKLARELPMIKPPAVSTIHAVLDRQGLVKRRKRRRHKAQSTELSAAHAPNGLWCADFKGEFMLGSKQYCYPLTITDYRSRYLLACEGLTSTRSKFAFDVFERVFKEFGLPQAIRTRVTRCGRICIGKRKINLSKVFAGECVGIREVDDQVWLVTFMDYDLGFFDRDEGRVEPAANPFAPEKVLTMSPE